MVEPLAHGPRLAGLAYRALIALPFERANLLGNLSLRLSSHVASIGCSVILDTYGHPPVPRLVTLADERDEHVQDLMAREQDRAGWCGSEPVQWSYRC